MREFVLACAVLAALPRPAMAEDLPPCRETVASPATLAGVEDPQTLLLEDGRRILLAGIEMPPDAKKVLLERLAGKPLTLHPVSQATDRYGRFAAFVHAADASTLIQQDLLRAGQARLGVRLGTAGCATALRAAERAARISGVGLWADPVYAVRRASEGRNLLEDAGRFTVVTGEVVSVRESGGTIYVNFGRRWSEALTVTILKRNERSFAEAGLTRTALERSRVTVRGFVEERNGPRIEVSRPEQIEIMQN